MVRNVFYFFDGTSNTLNSNMEQKRGKSVVAELFECNKSSHIQINLEHQCFELISKGQNNCFKIYFPGPGAKQCSFNKFLFHTPGRNTSGKKIHKSLWPKTYSNPITLYNQLTGNGWEHNLHSAVVAACNLLDVPQINHFIVGYSRGGITAISFSHELSQLIPANQNIYLFLIDPVAGKKYSTLKNMINYLDCHRKGFKKINPIIIGKKVKHVEMFYACTEGREEFLPQLPFRYDPELKRPLAIPTDANMDVVIQFLFADHVQIAFREHKIRKCVYEAGHIVYNRIINIISEFTNMNIFKPFPDIANKRFIDPHPLALPLPTILSDVLTPIAFTKKDRVIKPIVSLLKPHVVETFNTRKMEWHNVYNYERK